MKQLLFFIALLLLTGCQTLKEHQAPKDSNASLLEITNKFPHDWLGTYTGNLQAYRAGSNQNMYPAEVTLTIAETPDSNRWEWSSVYTVKGRDPIEKKYYIIHPDTLGPTQFIMDEDNGIFINQHLYGNSFSGAYKVNDQFFTFTYTKIKHELLYELTVYNGSPTESLEIEEGFEVGKIEMTNVQRVYFRKKQD
jgi:hypothetical protein